MTEQQEERAAAIRVELVAWSARDQAARLIVHLQDKVTELEHKIETCGLQCSATMKSLLKENRLLREDFARTESAHAVVMAENRHYKGRVAELERQLNKAEIERAWALGAFHPFQVGDPVTYLGADTTIKEVRTTYVLGGGTLATASLLTKRTTETTGDGQ